MRRLFLFVLLLSSLSLPTLAQRKLQVEHYDVALERIQEANYRQATELDLSNLGLRQIPPELGLLTRLEILNLSHNWLSEFPPEILPFTQLKNLNLADNNISSIPSEIEQLTTLESLNLASNQINDLPFEFRQLKNLRYLNLAGNEFVNFTTHITEHPQLEFLSLSHNQLIEVRPEIGQLTNLRQLDLTNNRRITYLPAEIGDLRELQVLILYATNLVEVPIEIEQLKNLCHLDLGDNQLSHIPTVIGKLRLLESDGKCGDTNYDSEISLHHNPPLISPPQEVREQGTATILAYLRNPLPWHLHRFIALDIIAFGFLLFFDMAYSSETSSTLSKTKTQASLMQMHGQMHSHLHPTSVYFCDTLMLESGNTYNMLKPDS